MKKLFQSLAGKLIVTLSVLIFMGTGAFWYISIQNDKKHLMDNAVLFLASFSEMVLKSIRYDMMQVDRDHIQHSLEYISDAESIKRVTLFSSGGTVHYSSDAVEIGKIADKSSDACIGCHQDMGVPKRRLDRGKQWNVFTNKAGDRVLSFVDPIYNEPDCSTAACHVHENDKKVLGILMTDFSLLPIDRMIEENKWNNSIIAVVFLALSATVLYTILWKLVLKPVRRLSKGMKMVSAGDLSHEVTSYSHDEIGRLARTFNEMISELGVARKRMEKWAESLEEEVLKKTEEIRMTQDRLIQSEKLAALGRMTADVAHEIRNPLTAVGGFGRRLEKIVKGEKEKEYSQLIVSEVARLEHVLRDVLIFSREFQIRLERNSLDDIVKESLRYFEDILREGTVQVKERYGSPPHVLLEPEQAIQAVINIISNAIDAMPDGGMLTIMTSQEQMNNLTYASVHVGDTGVGISEDKLKLIFDPFYTTKEIGKGTGLGLSISRKIIEEHGGHIKAENNEGAGLTISLYFPYQSEEESRKAPCWEFMQCGRNMNGEAKCPAYPHFGRACWAVAGTFCQGKVQGTFAQKSEDCRKCRFFQSINPVNA